ncbi:MAG: hypothetical protein WAR79_02035 [Melioribacteraceae bacterium]
MSKILFTIFSFLLIVGCCENKKNYLHELGILIKESETDKTKIDEAIQLLKSEYKNNPESKIAAKQLLSLYSQTGKNDSTLFLISSLIEEEKKEMFNFYHTRGMVKFNLKDYESAIEDYNNSLKTNGENKLIYNSIIIAKMWKEYYKDDQWNLTEEDIVKLINEVYPDNKDKPSVDEFRKIYQPK